jgi:hypothetical protein
VALYPYNRNEITVAIAKSDKADEEILQLEERGLGIHLYDEITSRREIEDDSVVATAFMIWSLGLSSDTKHGRSGDLRLQGPKSLYYHVPSIPTEVTPKDSLLAKVPGTFRGIDAVFVRGGQQSSENLVQSRATIIIAVKNGTVAVHASGGGSRRIHMDLGEVVSMAQLNLALSRIRYIPPTGWTLTDIDQITIQVQFGTMREQLDIPVIQRTSKIFK